MEDCWYWNVCGYVFDDEDVNVYRWCDEIYFDYDYCDDVELDWVKV